MNKIEGLHHLAISTGDMKGQIEFFSDVLGMELVALYWMHGADGYFHGFMRMNDESTIAFVFAPENRKLESDIGQTHPGNPAGTSAPGTLQHVSLKVKDMEEMLALQNRIRSKGIPVIGPIDHGMCFSMYFAGLENLSLEVSCNDDPIDPKAWIDPEVVELCGISAEELERYRSSPDFISDGKPVLQPGLDSKGPHMQGYPDGLYEAALSMSDAEVAAMMNENEPPVRV